MTDIFLFEPDRKICGDIQDIFADYSIRKNIDHRPVNIINDIPEKLPKELYTAETALYIIGCGSETIRLAADIAAVNPLNYIIMLADSLEDILMCVSPVFRPSGILMKPIDRKAAEQMFDSIFSDLHSSRTEELFRFKIRSREYSVSADSILFFEALNKKMILRTDGQQFEFYMSSEEILKQLPEYFVKIHKSYIVNTKYISLADYKNMTVTMCDGSQVYISRTYKKALAEAMDIKRRVCL